MVFNLAKKKKLILRRDDLLVFNPAITHKEQTAGLKTI